MQASEMLFFMDPQIAASDPDATAKLILSNMARLRKGETLSPPFVDLLAGAFERSLALPPKKRGAALARELKLTYGSRRPRKINDRELAEAYYKLIASGEKQGGALMELSLKLDVSESTLRRRLQKYEDSQSN